MNTLRVCNRAGDSVTTWDPDDASLVQEAKRVFDAFKRHNYLAYKKKEGNAGEQLREFDPNAHEIVMHEPLIGG